MEQAENHSFAEILGTLLLGIVAGILTAFFSEFIKAEYEDHRSTKIVLLKEMGDKQVSCDPLQEEMEQLSPEPVACWEIRFKLSRTGSPQPVHTLDVH